MFLPGKGDLHATGRALGRALHYIHDGAVKTTRDDHDKIEREMDQLVDKLSDLCKKRGSKAV